MSELPTRSRRRKRLFSPASSDSTVIPGRVEDANPESRDSPMCNCTSEVWSFGPSRNDGSPNRKIGASRLKRRLAIFAVGEARLLQIEGAFAPPPFLVG